MKIQISDENITIYIFNKIKKENLEKENLEEYIKQIIINIKNRYKKKISGYYQIYVYQNDNYGIIIDMEKIDELDLFPDIIDLKVEVIYNSDIYLQFQDYFLIEKLSNNVYYYNDNYYINIDDIKKDEIIKLSEFYTVIYGKELYNLEEQLKKI